MTIKDKYVRVYADSKKVKDFEELATYIVDKDCTDLNGKPLKGIPRDILIKDFSLNMCIGSESTKDKYLMRGMVASVAILCAGMLGRKIYCAWKRRNNECNKTAEENQM